MNAYGCWTKMSVSLPSFPQAKLITVGGYLIVQDQPLGLSEYYSGDLTPEDASFIPSLLQADWPDISDHQACDLREVIKGREAILEGIQELRHWKQDSYY